MAGAARAHAGPLDQGEEHQDPDSDPSAANGQQWSEVVPQGRDHPGQADAVGDPVAPADQEPCPTPKRFFGVDVPAPCSRHGRRELSHTDGAQQGVGGSQHPNPEDQRLGGQLIGHQPRDPQDASPNGSANGARKPKAHAKHFEQAAGIVQTSLPMARTRLTNALLSMWTRSSNRQENLAWQRT